MRRTTKGLCRRRWSWMEASRNRERPPGHRVPRETPRLLRQATVLLLPVLLSGCGLVVLFPAGDVAWRERNLLVISTVLMLLIIVPVIALTLTFARRYRETNPDAYYDPEFHHSTQLEVVIWTAPLMIIIALGAITWLNTHVLDPYRTLTEHGEKAPAGATRPPLNVEVVALDWKWLFFYPDEGVATVNDLAAPLGVPISFRITSANLMNSFFVPALAGQIYAMAGMITPLHAIVEQPGTYTGFSANYTGAGFSRMNFTFRALSPQDFDAWIAKAKASGQTLDRAAYLKLQEPSQDVPATYYGSYEKGLFDRIANLCVRPGSMCLDEVRAIDAKGGAGIDSQGNVARLEYDNLRLQAGEPGAGRTTPAPPLSERGTKSEQEPGSPAPRAGEPTTQVPGGQMPGMNMAPGQPPPPSGPPRSGGQQGMPGQ